MVLSPSPVHRSARFALSHLVFLPFPHYRAWSQAIVNTASWNLLSTISDKIVETLYSNSVSSKNKAIHTPPLSPPFKIVVFVVFYG